MTDWRNRMVTRSCRYCAGDFEGKYNATRCEPCGRQVKGAAMTAFKAKNPTYWRDRDDSDALRGYRLRRAYGMDAAEWDELHAAQQGCCAICGASSGWVANAGRLVVDHDHVTGKVRALLCPSCNRGLGQFEDDPHRLRAAANYLDHHVDREIARREAQR